MDIFIGVLANAGLVVLGASIGLAFRKIKKMGAISERIMQAFSLFVIMLGIQGVSIEHPVYYLLCLIIGVGIGEVLDIDKQFNRFGSWIEQKFSKDGQTGNFTEGFVAASLLYCIGSMTFLGAIQSGIQHEHSIYLTKGIIDGISSITLAMSSGFSVAFSALSILVYQGILTAGASLLGNVLFAETIDMCVAVGSLFLIAIGLNVLGLTKIKVANFLPAMFIPMLWQLLQSIF